ncbi:phage portal protein [Bradyrhizobium sp. AZCC 1721]|uniref:phage portal protein n=1 Tax=Bradyrhizobium sp. AZCC 1721 TaxID=3117016 RepID=UPI002FF3D7E1
MGFTLNPLSWFERKSTNYNLSDPRLIELFGSTPTASGIAVSAQAALRVPAFHSAVRVIAETNATLPLHLYKRVGDVKAKDTGNPLYRLLHDEPNAWSSSYDLRVQMGIDAMLHGNAYAYVNRIDGQVREIVRLPPTNVTVKMPDAIGPPTYEVTESAGGRRLEPFTDVIHIRALSSDGVNGISPVHLGREALALALALEQSHASLHANGAQPGGVLAVKGKLDKDARVRLKEQWQAFQGGTHNKFKTAVLDVDAEWKPLSMTGVDSQHLETRRFQIEEISRLTRVPPHLLSELGRATWGNAAEMGQSFLDYCLLPWIRQWEGALTRALLTPDERKTHFIEFDTSGLVRANLQARSESYWRAIGGPYLTPNEVRAIENRPPIDDGNVLNKPTRLGAANDNNDSRNAAA